MASKSTSPTMGIGDTGTRYTTTPLVIRNAQQWEESYTDFLGLVVVEFYPPWAAPSTALANAVRGLRPQISQEPLKSVAMPTDLAKSIFRLAAKPPAGIALAYRGRLLQKLPSWDLVGLRKAVLEFFDRSNTRLATSVPQPLPPVRVLRAEYAAPKLIRNLADAVRSSNALERMRKKLEGPDDNRSCSRWHPPQLKPIK